MMAFNNSFREAIGRALVDAGEAYKKLIVIDTDLSVSTRSIYFAERFPDRFIQVGISEQDAVGTAAGLAIGGKIPVIISYAMFLLRGWEQIRNTVARDNLNVKIVGTHSGLSDYLDGSSHQCLEDIALMRVIPNFTVVSPADQVATYSLFMQQLEVNGPTYLRLGRDNASTIYTDEGEVTLGKANVLVDGDDITIISHGAMVSIALQTSRLLRNKGIRARVIDMHTIKPMDINTLMDACTEAPPIFVIEDHNIIGGLGGAITEAISDTKPVLVIRIGIEDRFGTGTTSYENLLEYFGFTPQKLVDKIMGVLNGI